MLRSVDDESRQVWESMDEGSALVGERGWCVASLFVVADEDSAAWELFPRRAEKWGAGGAPRFAFGGQVKTECESGDDVSSS